MFMHGRLQSTAIVQELKTLRHIDIDSDANFEERTQAANARLRAIS